MFQEDKREQVHVNSSWLVLSNNNLTGSIPDPVSELVNLTLLDLSSNNLSGSFELDKLSRFGKLQHLYLSDNTLLSFTSASNANYSSPDLSTLNLSSCNTSEFPNFVSNLPATTFDEQEADSEFGLVWKTVMMSYGCGVVLGFSAGYIMMEIRKPKWLVGMVQRAGYH
ncbi:hypothetical protein F3Y22_tig00111342pilonHSYRG00177 [Hibiscus syriacus]|uniref:Uncharacterized protein n=1 Tax=Hibiscus syriacus TaxID=106335 RepID=A0A6A2YP43_HIBSY|nr:hypothetical protein F3Y22_tig00111342pilonHSYRG00177 [Hibiscus syriacus]